jgi:hypothetical protein
MLQSEVACVVLQLFEFNGTRDFLIKRGCDWLPTKSFLASLGPKTGYLACHNEKDFLHITIFKAA